MAVCGVLLVLVIVQASGTVTEAVEVEDTAVVVLEDNTIPVVKTMFNKHSTMIPEHNSI